MGRWAGEQRSEWVVVVRKNEWLGKGMEKLMGERVDGWVIE